MSVRKPPTLPIAPQRTQFWLTSAEAIDKLGISKAEFERIVRRGLLEIIPTRGRRMVSVKSVKAYYMERLRASEDNV